MASVLDRASGTEVSFDVPDSAAFKAALVAGPQTFIVTVDADRRDDEIGGVVVRSPRVVLVAASYAAADTRDSTATTVSMARGDSEFDSDSRVRARADTRKRMRA